MCDGRNRGMTRYDLVGANNRRLNRYKSKYNPELVTFYQIEHGPLSVRAIAHLYKNQLSPKVELFTRTGEASLPARLVSGVIHR